MVTPKASILKVLEVLLVALQGDPQVILNIITANVACQLSNILRKEFDHSDLNMTGRRTASLYRIIILFNIYF